MKKSYIILIIVVVLAAIVWIVERPDKPDTGDFAPFVLFPKLLEQHVKKVEVAHLVSGSLLQEAEEGWTVTELETPLGKKLQSEEGGEETTVFPKFKADLDKIERLRQLLVKLEARSLASINSEKQNTYQVGKLAKHIIIYNEKDDKIVDLYIGKNGPDMFSSYVRRGEDDEVYLVNEQVGAAAPADVMSWRNKLIWNIDKDSIVGVNVDFPENPEKSYAIEKDETNGWEYVRPREAPVDKGLVRIFIKGISDLEAARFALVIDQRDTGLDKPVMELSIKTVDGRTPKLIIGGEDKQGYIHARLEGGSEVYLLPSNFNEKIPDEWTSLSKKQI